MSESMAEWERELLASQPDRMRFSRKWTSSDGDTRCQRCGQDNVRWVQSAPSAPSTAPLTAERPPADHGDGSGAGGGAEGEGGK